ncbi:MAG: GHKL domain-containing protein [Bacilli bacterium]|nr:GHKL domain-containing protein [Bacilli bacterium]
MLDILITFIIKLINILGITYISSKILNCDINFKRPKNYINILVSSILLFLAKTYIIDGYIKFLCLYIITFILSNILYKQNIFKSIISSIFTLIIITISELLCSLILTMFIQNYNQIVNNTIFYLIVNIIIIITACIITTLNKTKLNKFIEKININNDLSFFIITLTFTAILINPILNLINNNINIFSVGIIILFSITYIYILFLLKNKKMENKYNELYSQVNIYEQLIEKYIKLNHQHKNNLVLIKSMIENKCNKDVINYINDIIGETDIYKDEFKIIKSTIFKGFLNNKLSVIKEQKINLHLEISNSIKKIDIDKILPKNRINDFYSILGIILDNAIEATVNCKDKIISIDMYLNNNQYIINVSNTFNNEVNLYEIEKKGYSTKGKDRGYGLSILNDIINKSSIFEIKREIIKNIFSCELIINMKENE